MNRSPYAGTAIARRSSRGKLALPADLLEAARDYARAAHAPRTRVAYARAWTGFETWCAEKGLPPLPGEPGDRRCLDGGPGQR
jgi:hypothetical protein